MRARVLTRSLPGVTLLAATSVAISATARALALSQRDLDFGQVLFLSDMPPPPATPAEWRRIARIGSRGDYSQFMLHELGTHLTTDHVLCIQWDGYVLNAANWDPAFLDYDYIGAPWPQFGDHGRVGNGGFSLRSRRQVDACATLPVPDEAEDVAICRTHRSLLENRFGLRFAPEELARRFAYERIAPTGDEFGFHGAFNMIDRIPTRELAEMLGDIAPGLLSRKEHREMLRSALRRGHFRLAWTLWNRLRHPAARQR